MKSAPFYFEIKDIMTQFVSAFNDIIINRHDKYKNVRSKAHVRYVYAPKQRVVHDLTNKARHLTLPVVAVNINNVSRDVDRVFNKLEGSYYPTGSQTNTKTDHVLQPVPIDISVNMSILARYQTDVEQILSNFIPYNDPYIILSWKVPEEIVSIEQEIRSEVLWSGDIAMTYPDNLTSTEPYRLSCDTQFTIKTWLFKHKARSVENIYRITANYITDDDNSLLDNYYERESSYDKTIGPPLTGAPHITYIGDSGLQRDILGYNFDETTSVYVSGVETNQSNDSISVKPFDRENLSTLYPPFTAVPVNYNIINDNRIQIDMRDFNVDVGDKIIIQNKGGYTDIKLN